MVISMVTHCVLLTVSCIIFVTSSTRQSSFLPSFHFTTHRKSTRASRYKSSSERQRQRPRERTLQVDTVAQATVKMAKRERERERPITNDSSIHSPSCSHTCRLLLLDTHTHSVTLSVSPFHFLWSQFRSLFPFTVVDNSRNDL